MEEIISKELLSEVFNKEVTNILSETDSKVLKNHIVINFTNGDILKINIHELTYKCKEWALKENFRVSSQMIERGIKFSDGINGFIVVHTCNREVFKARADTEPEAIFKACQWIYERLQNEY